MPENERGTQHFKPKENPPPVGKNYLLAIGIDQYADQGIRNLRNAVSDVKAVVGLLAERYYFSPPNNDQETVLLLDQAATRAKIIGQLKAFGNKVKEPDSLVIYFAGHGEMDGPRGYWIPHDGLAKDTPDGEHSWVINSDLTSYLGDCTARHIFFLVDSCFPATLLRESRDTGTKNAQLLYSRPSRMALVSGGLEPVSDGVRGGHSPFATCLLNFLGSHDGPYLRAAELCLKVEEEIPKYIPGQHPSHGNVNDLLASYMGKPKGEFVFFTRPKPPAPNPAEAAWQAALAAYDDFLEQHPDSPHAEEAETRIRALEEALAKTQLDELTLFIQTQDSHSLSDVRDYLKTYPQGQYIKEVQALRERLRNQLPSTSSLANENPPPAESPVNPALQVTKHVPHVNFTETVSGVSFNMIYVESGEFMMGDTFGEGNRDELPVHPVILDGCYLGETVVTQSLYRAVTGRNPSYFKLGDEHPVEQVSWDDAQDFIQKLNQYTGKKYTLPTEAQWEFAARGGTSSLVRR
ncbi:MAG: SUMF1/EgtB/PvdO family nonheme iron enzyme [Bernardetiaceae bacterium]|nr:SUMF1/EgtB/PvdO family nonheme iron enzyme [Bernardetiaceae bacterium]